VPEATPSTPRGRPRLVTWRRSALAVAWVLSLAVAAKGTLFVSDNRDAIMRRLGRVEMNLLLETNLYAVAAQKVVIPIDGRYGAIAPHGRGVLFASRSGRMHLADSTRAVHPIALRVPIDVATFDADPKNGGTVDKDHFAVKDLLVERSGATLFVAASHNYWDSANDCYGLRVSVTEVAADSLATGGPGTWRTLFDTPCRKLALLANGQRRPTIGAGGRLALLAPGDLLLTVGTFGTENAMEDDTTASNDPDSPLGKTMRIDVRTGAARIFTRGHRNPQGLAVASDGRIWLTEHAARGGDELNLLRDGADYGFPHVAYGTAYGMMVYPPSKAQGRHDGFEKPMLAFVPSVATSQLIEVTGDLFPHWRGDLLVSSLARRSLFRVRIEDGRALFVEPVEIGSRLRDIVQTAGGEIVLLAEDGFLIYLDPVDTEATDPDLLPRERGQLVASRCQGCHTFQEGGPAGLGPNLHGVLGRGIASTDFTYSDALRAQDGRWTEETLRAYIADPARFAPGTTMVTGFSLTDAQLDDLLTYLRTLR
jgi:glucose/arabinose dehydrogenase/cytochrome c2